MSDLSVFSCRLQVINTLLTGKLPPRPSAASKPTLDAAASCDAEEDGEEEGGDAFEEEGSVAEDVDEEEQGDEGGEDVDMEDLGGAAPKRGKAGPAPPPKEGGSAAAPEMLTPMVRSSLTKQVRGVDDRPLSRGESRDMQAFHHALVIFLQGYKLIGSHSGVKMCRWTKSMLRGRGGCYKHAFYGIESHRCMEATPSLACANK